MFDKHLGATRPVAPLTETERTRLRELVELHAPRLRKVQFTSLEDKLQAGISSSLTVNETCCVRANAPALLPCTAESQ